MADRSAFCTDVAMSVSAMMSEEGANKFTDYLKRLDALASGKPEPKPADTYTDISALIG